MKQVEEKLKKARKDIRDAEAVATAREGVKAFSPAMLGQGKKNGGGEQYRKARHEAMNRVRAIAALSLDQKHDWQYFSSTWDEQMAAAHGENWATLFAEMMQNVCNELAGGNNIALSEFMRRESERIVGGRPYVSSARRYDVITRGHGAPAPSVPGTPRSAAVLSWGLRSQMSGCSIEFLIARGRGGVFASGGFAAHVALRHL